MQDKIVSLLKYAMKMELDSKEFYVYNLDRVTSPTLKAMFEELIEMEKNHFEVLKTMLDLMENSEPPITISWVIDDTHKEVNPSILADNSDIISDDSAINDLSIVRLAYLMENDFALFYTNAAETIEDEKAKDFILELAKWEKQHAAVFKKRYEELLKSHWSEVTKVVFS